MLKSILAYLIWLSVLGYGAEFQVDHAHSSVEFKAKHMMVSRVPGKFKEFRGHWKLDEKTGKVTELAGTVTAESVDTNNMKRDDHLKNADFFDVSNYPELSFNLRKHNLSTSKMLAEITLLGITKPVLFNAEVSEVIKHPFSNDGKMIQAIILEGIIKRSDFGFGKKYADKIISEKIVIQISLEGRKK